MAIGTDIDEVVFPLVRHECKFLNKKHNINLTEEDFTIYNFWEIPKYKINGVQATREQARDDFLEFSKTSDFRKIQPYGDARKAIFELSEIDFVVGVTSRQHELENHTRWQLGYYFRRAFSDVVFGNHHSSNSRPSVSKRELCKDNYIWLLFEDNLDYAKEVSADIPVILFKRPWNSSFVPTPGSNIHSVDNWEQAVPLAKKLYKRPITPDVEEAIFSIF